MRDLKFLQTLKYNTFIYCTPVPKQSVKQANGHFYTPKKQVKYVEKLKQHFGSTYVLAPLEGFVFIEITFLFPRKSGEGIMFYMGKSDLDNLTKPVLDAAAGILFNNDKQIVYCQLGKFKSYSPGILINFGKILLKSIFMA